MLEDLQRALESTYRIEIDLDVNDFVLSDPGTADALSPDVSRSRESLLVRESEAGLELSLYLDAADLERLAEDGPVQHLADPRLDPFCRTAEGVSHFVMLAWRAQRQWPVSRFELELQAEVDKYLICRLSGVGEGQPLLDALFTRVRYRDDLTIEESGRYRAANDMGHDYCRALAQLDDADVVREVRRFYRYGQREKVGHIAALAKAA
jgi:hypothetical protein